MPEVPLRCRGTGLRAVQAEGLGGTCSVCLQACAGARTQEHAVLSSPSVSSCGQEGRSRVLFPPAATQ